MTVKKKKALWVMPALLSFVIALSMALPCAAQAQVATQQDLAYLALVDKAVQDPKHADWCRIRDMYADTSFYRQHGAQNLRKDTAQAAQPVITDNTRQNEIAFNVYLRQNFGSVGTHIYADTLYRLNTYGFIDDKLHLQAMRGIMECITDKGDTKTPASAVPIISIEEMEAVAQQVFDMNPRGIDGLRFNETLYLDVLMKNEAGTRERHAFFKPDPRLVELIKREKVAMAEKHGKH